MKDNIRMTREELRQMSSAIDDLMNLGRRVEAEQQLKEALQAAAHDQAYHLFFQGEAALYIERDHRSRERLLLEGIKEAPDDVFLLRNLGGGYLMDEKYHKARRTLERALQAEPHDADVLRDLGLLSSAKGRESRAIDWFRKAIAVKPNDYDAMRQIGVCYSKLGRDEDAINWYRNALACNSQDYDAMRQMGISFAMLGQYDTAIDWLNHALEINPGDRDSHRNLGLVRVKMDGKSTTFLDRIMIRIFRRITLYWRRLIDRLDQPDAL